MWRSLGLSSRLLDRSLRVRMRRCSGLHSRITVDVDKFGLRGIVCLQRPFGMRPLNVPFLAPASAKSAVHVRMTTDMVGNNDTFICSSIRDHFRSQRCSITCDKMKAVDAGEAM